MQVRHESLFVAGDLPKDRETDNATKEQKCMKNNEFRRNKPENKRREKRKITLLSSKEKGTKNFNYFSGDN